MSCEFEEDDLDERAPCVNTEKERNRHLKKVFEMCSQGIEGIQEATEGEEECSQLQ
jgi:hypothetical protein